MAAAVVLPGPAVSPTSDGWRVQVPVSGAPGMPRLRTAPGEVTVEIPDGRVERMTTRLLGAADDKGSGGQGAEPRVREIVTTWSRSHRRASITVRLSTDAEIAAEHLDARLSEGLLQLAWHRPQAAAPPAPVRPEARREPPRAQGPAPPPDSSTREWLRTPPAGRAAPGTALEGPQRSALDILLRVLAPAILLGGAAWLWLRRRSTRVSDLSPTAINVVARRVLGRTQQLLVIDVNHQQMLISVSEQGGARLIAALGSRESDQQDRSRAQGGHIAEGRAATDPLDNIFSDMLDECAGEVQPASPQEAPRADAGREGRAAAPVRPAPIRAGRDPAIAPARPNLQLVDDRMLGEDAAQIAINKPVTAAAQAPSPATADLGANADVAGLLALRRHRQGAMR